MTHSKKQPLDIVTFVAVAVTLTFWSSAFSAIRVGLESYSPWHLTLVRFSVASMVFIVYALVVRLPMPERSDWPRIFAAGFLGITVYHTALNIGEVHVPAGTASLIIAAAPIFTALLARRFLSEELTPWGWAGIGLSFAGVAFIVLGRGSSLGFTAGAFTVLLAAISTSGFFILEKPLFERYSPIQLTAYVTWAGTLPMLLYAPGITSAIPQASSASTLAAVYTGIFPAAIAYVAWSIALSRSPASKVSSFLYVNPVLAILIAWIWIDELPTAMSLVGGAFAIAGVVIVNSLGKRPRRRKHRKGALEERPRRHRLSP